MMFKKRLLLSIISAAAATAAYAVYKQLKSEDMDETDEFEEEDDEVNFIEISDGEEEQPAETELIKEVEVPAEVKEIAPLYPYLSEGFIAGVFARHEEFEKTYPEDSLITVRHTASFEAPEGMDTLLKIADEEGYLAEAADGKMCVLTRKMFTEEGSILGEIYNVANQVAALGGTYQGYTID